MFPSPGELATKNWCVGGRAYELNATSLIDLTVGLNLRLLIFLSIDSNSKFLLFMPGLQHYIVKFNL